ncbi:tetratricopeptide repeat protein [Nocardiopsis potens]|uniref:tetratricopeptide repeat protein n=1 Tax=Nocardiopsis potens TaxID=1246458 RepID=UPI00035D914B|nr:tetratricopeptide repeat protein [Nocardiopsis potens]
MKNHDGRPHRDEVGNEIGGDAGSAVQAGTVRGDVHSTSHRTTIVVGADRESARTNMPAAPAVFVDREHDLGEIGRLLDRATGTCVVLCEGPRGIGKSALLLRAADEFAPRFPDGRLYYDYSQDDGPRRADPDAALTQFLLTLGVREEFLPGTYEGRLAEYRNRTAGRAVLVVVEGAEEPAQVRQLVPTGPRSALLACGDGPALAELSIEPGGALPLPLDPLSEEHARELLRALCPRLDRDADGPALDRLAAACEGLPLALVMVAGRLGRDRRADPAALADELSDEKRRLAAIRVNGGTTLSAAFGLCYRRLSAGAAELYRALGAWPGEAFDAGLAAAALGESAGSGGAAPLLDELTAANLLVEEAGGRFRFRHGLIVLDARDRAEEEDSEAVRTGRLRRMLDLFMVPLAFADRAVMGKRTSPVDLDALTAGARDPFPAGDGRKKAALAWLRSERGTLPAAVRAAAAAGLYDRAWKTAVLATALYMNIRYLQDWAESGLLGAEAAREDGDPRGEIRLRTTVSRPLADLGRMDQAERQIERAMELAGSIGDVLLEASAHEFHGRYLDLVDRERALAAYTRAEELCSSAEGGEDGENARRGAALAVYFRGRTLAGLGRTGEAAAELEDALGRFLGLPEPDERMAARVRASLGDLHLKEGDPQRALPYFTDAISALERQGGNSHYEATARESLADALTALGLRGEARRHLRRALAIHREGGGPRARDLERRLEEDGEG